MTSIVPPHEQEAQNVYTPSSGPSNTDLTSNVPPQEEEEEEKPGSLPQVIVKKRRNVRKKALIVGINEYQNPNNNLSGCVNDAMDMAETLKICGFPRTKIKLLFNEQASKAGILNGLNWLTKDAAENDVLVFYYSGHGSNVADLDDDEHDNVDEIIVPWDIDWRTQKYITDDNLYDLFTNKVPKTVRTDVILDSCYSGSATRSQFRYEGQYRQQRFLPPPLDHQFAINSMIPQFTKKKEMGQKIVAKTQNDVLWSGCQENQVAWELELGGQVRGAFTYYFTRILRKSNGQLPREEIYTTLRNSMASDGFEQVPNLEVPNPEALGIFPFRKTGEIDTAEELQAATAVSTKKAIGEK